MRYAGASRRTRRCVRKADDNGDRESVQAEALGSLLQRFPRQSMIPLRSMISDSWIFVRLIHQSNAPVETAIVHQHSSNSGVNSGSTFRQWRVSLSKMFVLTQDTDFTTNTSNTGPLMAVIAAYGRCGSSCAPRTQVPERHEKSPSPRIPDAVSKNTVRLKLMTLVVTWRRLATGRATWLCTRFPFHVDDDLPLGHINLHIGDSPRCLNTQYPGV